MVYSFLGIFEIWRGSELRFGFSGTDWAWVVYWLDFFGIDFGVLAGSVFRFFLILLEPLLFKFEQSFEFN